MKAVKHRLNEDMKTRLMTGELAEFCQERGISLIVLFGSQVRGSAKEGSDVDLGLVLDTYPIKPEEELNVGPHHRYPQPLGARVRDGG
jgi:predicted nucleotidyltransferase